MATAPQAAIEMPQQGANPYEDPNTMAIYDQMRQSMSPKEFGDELLAGASQVDPQAMAQFREELSQIDLSPEELNSLNDMVDEVIASPEQYDALREKYLKMGMPEELLPEQFDGQFFAALNMAIDQLIAEPAGVQAFAKGGIAELKPIAKTIASYGRNGDTMLAHITPAEARMLRRRGGSGTINPATGLPEFFLKKAFKSLGKAVKSFASSTVGKIVTTVALGFFLGPAAASMLGATSTAAVAAVSGFVGSAGSTLLGGGNLKDALKAGAVGGLTAGAGAGIMGGADAFASGSYTGPTTISGQYDRLMGTPAAPAAPSGPAISQTGQVSGMAPNPADATQFEGSLAKTTSTPSFMDKATDFYNKNISPSGIQEQGAANAIQTVQKTFPTATAEQIMSAPAGSALAKAYSAAMPGIFSTYAPITAASLGVMGLAGGFKSTPAAASEMKSEMMKSATDRIAEKGKQKEYYVQNLPGVKYDEFGAPIYGQYNPLPTTPASTTPTSNFDLPSTIGGIGSLYTPPSGTMGTQQPIAQPYNTASMYTNLMPRPPGYAEGGDVRPSAESAAMIDAQRAAMIAQAQALGQTGYAPTSPGSYGVERGSYTPSTGFAEFTQQYRQNNPAPVPSRPSTGGTTAAPVGNTAAPVGSSTPPVGNTTASSSGTELMQNGFNEDGTPILISVPKGAAGNALYTPPPVGNTAAPVGNTAAPVGNTTAPPDTELMQSGFNEDGTPLLINVPKGSAGNALYTPPPAPAYTPPPEVDYFAQQFAPDVSNPTPAAQPPATPMDGGIASLPVTAPTAQSPVAPYEPPPEVDYFAQQFAPDVSSPTPAAPAYEAPAYQAPAYEAPTYQAPAYEAPTYQAPAYEAPAYQAPTYQEPAYMPPPPEVDYFAQQFAFNTGGIASLRSGGYPRRTGQISGPGTATSDSIPAMLSDGEFVMTAKAVRGAGKGDRRAGAKRMYALMHQLEQNAARG
jgi:hypothetical protein